MYLCYDIKGIQRFIFSVPKLKCIIGASGLIAEFDGNSPDWAKSNGAVAVFSGGGRGAFDCPSQAVADRFVQKLIAEAKSRGLDLQIGVADRLADAVHHADRLYSYCPDSLEGEPCRVSGIWPTKPNSAHPLIRQRYEYARRDPLGQSILTELETRGLLPGALVGRNLAFFKNIHPDPQEGDDRNREEREARAGRNSLGDRNRWAVVAMDGNDLGRQFLAFQSQSHAQGWPETRLRDWLRAMSGGLARCTRDAFLKALAAVIGEWAEAVANDDDLDLCEVPEPNGNATLILPFRPLVLGGDDLTMLCHSSYAMSFVQKMAAEFQKLSRTAAVEAGDLTLWPATEGRLTISAGVLYAPVTFPLHMAIPYAESLLASSKGKFRSPPQSKQPTPSAVDWEAITDSMVDTPAARRNRELRFHDAARQVEVCLTRRPYLLEAGPPGLDLKELQRRASDFEKIPPSVRAQILPALQRPWSERVAFQASIAKRHPNLFDLLWEGGGKLGRGWSLESDGKIQSTGVPDALLLLEEEGRFTKPTQF